MGQIDPTPRPLAVGSICSGVDGLALGIELAGQPIDVRWQVEIDPDCRRVLAQRWPEATLYNDVATFLERDSLFWTPPEPVDLLIGGYPCQPFSHAGHRLGVDDERHVWPHIADAIRQLRPAAVFFENVRGHLSLGFDEVLADLAAVGFNAEWGVFSSAEVGAPHRRERLYVYGWRATADTDGSRREGRRGQWDEARRLESPVGPGPATTDTGRRSVQRRPVGRGVGDTEGDGAGERQQRERRRDHARDGGSARRRRYRPGGRDDSRRRHLGKYEAAVRRWEAIIGPAPDPVLIGPQGGTSIRAEFVEWMMGYPPGWFTDGMERRAALSAGGNSVQPQTAARAYRELSLRSTLQPM